MIFGPCVLTVILLVVNQVKSDQDSSLSGRLLDQLGIKLPREKELRTRVSVVAGNTAELPCNTTSEQEKDSARLILWFKEEGNKPIYTYDKRGGLNAKDARHYSDDNVFKGRAYFRGDSTPGMLVVERVSVKDQGEYRCRTDFQVSPTRISVVELDVITPPEKPTIYDEYSNAIIRHKLGPYREGETVNLRCEVLGGDPTPEVTWWRDHNLLDTSQQNFKHKVVNTLRISSMKRSDLHSIYTCQASNNNLSVPVSTSAKLDLTYGPELVKIVGMKQSVSAGVQYKVRCLAQGSRPDPTISWFLGSQPLHDLVSDTVTSPDGKVTTSTILYTPKPGHNGDILRCRAELEDLPGSAIETSWNLVVHYTPKASLHFGKSLDPHNIKENQDVYFECNTASNPPPTRIYWTHNGLRLNQEVGKGIIQINRTLVLQKVSRRSAGNYTCQAENVEGTGESDILPLTVQYVPECRPGQLQVYGVGKHETVRIRCEVNANPDTGLTFSWWFNTTRERIDFQASQITSKGSTSWLEYTPRTELDYGTLQCRAENHVGVQHVPCSFSLVPAGVPDPVHNCTASNQSYSAIQVSCSPGFNGGLKQSFFLEVENLEQKSISNISSPSPVFSITGLEADTEYRLYVHAGNSKGLSGKVSIAIRTPELQPSLVYQSDQAKLGSLKTKFTVTPILGVLIGVGAAILLVSFTIISILCCRSNYEKVSMTPGARKEPGKEDPSPDIIPKGEDSYKQISRDEVSSAQSLEDNQGGGGTLRSTLHRQRYLTPRNYQNQDLDVLKHIHNNISRLGTEDDFPDLKIIPNEDVYSPLLLPSTASPTSSLARPSSYLSYTTTNTQGVSSSSSRDDYSMDAPLISDSGNSGSNVHHPHPHQNLHRLDRESAV